MREKERERERERELRPRDREHSAGSSYSHDATKISGRPFRNRSARVRPEFNIEHSRPAPSRKHHADVDRTRVPSLSFFLALQFSSSEKNVSFFPLGPSQSLALLAFFFFVLPSVGQTRSAGPLKLGSCPLAQRRRG